MTDTLKLYTFGGLSIQQADSTVKGFVSRKVDALFVYLAYNKLREHPREVLASMLWDDLPQERSMSNLRTVLSSLQSRLAPYLSITRQTVSINPEADIWLDAHVLEATLDLAEKQTNFPADKSRATAAKLEQALLLFKGEFLAGFNLHDSRGFEGWQTLERERLRGRIIDAQSRLVDHYLETHQYSAGIDHALQLLQLDSLLEEAHCQLMLLYANSGQIRAALAQYESCRALLEEELGIEPSLVTQETYRRIQSNEITVSREIKSPPHNLPLPSTPFIDRPVDIAHVMDALGDPRCRLITILGAGGSGKTRLSLQAAVSEVPNFADGVFQINLAPLQTSSFIASAISETLNIGSNGQKDSKSELFKYLSKRQMLLVLDNFEHLLDGVDIVLDLLHHAPHLKLLVTSRERLNLQEEWVVTIGGMAYPSSLTAEVGQYTAAQLFTQNARRIAPGFSLAENADAVSRICQLVQGMPLALELAASWLRVMTCSQIADEIAQNLDILQSSLRNVAERHRSIRATFDASWALLTEVERKLLSQLSVFQGSFPQTAAQQITRASALTLLALQDKSLLSADSGYYELHPLLKQFALEKFDAYPEEKRLTQAAHSRYYVDRIEYFDMRSNSTASTPPDHELAREIENIRAAWHFALLQRDAALASQFLRPLYNYFDSHCHYYEGEAMFEWASQQLISAGAKPDESLVAQLRILQGSMFVCMSQYVDGQQVIQDNLPVLQQGDLPWVTRIGLASLGTIAYARGNYLGARSYYEQALPFYEPSSEMAEIINMDVRRGDIATVLGEYQKAHDILIARLPDLDRLQGKRGRLAILNTLGDLEYKLGNYASAKQRFTASLIISNEMNDNTGRGVALVSLGRTAYALGTYSEAVALCSQSITLCNETHNQWGLAFALAHQGRAYHAQQLYGQALQVFQSALTICQEMGIRWVSAFTLRQASRSNLALNRLADASENAYGALEIASEIKAKPLILDSLIGVAALLPKRDHVLEAYKIALFVNQNPISEHETKTEAAALISVLQRLVAGSVDMAFVETSSLEAIVSNAFVLKPFGLSA
jgi:predicted ATPase/DNA-binding SARP family transcriptional activator